MKNCKLQGGVVSGASFIREASHCHVHLCSQQIRIHDSTHTDFFLLAKSNPIIEHCSGVRFGKYKCVYGKLGEHLKECAMEGNNLFASVLDFQWHK
mmetsp:Transcript_20768/g.15278  ORF Transcript_20768/g.15278 Transcript_20768/m.15278 type:complete len:96 (+) Transcript_20768:220-507(+)